MKLRRGFTLTEVLVASGVIVSLAAGILVTTWKMVGFARGEAERMMADNLAHDIMRAVYSQRFDDIVKIDECKLSANVLPQIVSQGVSGKTSDPVCSLWRDGAKEHQPSFKVAVETKVKTLGGKPITNKLITVTIRWWNDAGEQTHSPVEQERYPFGDGS